MKNYGSNDKKPQKQQDSISKSSYYSPSSTQTKIGTYSQLPTNSNQWKKSDLLESIELTNDQAPHKRFNKMRQPFGDVEQAPKWFQLCDEVIICCFFEDEPPCTLGFDIDQYRRIKSNIKLEERISTPQNNKSQLKYILKTTIPKVQYTRPNQSSLGEFFEI